MIAWFGTHNIDDSELDDLTWSYWHDGKIKEKFLTQMQKRLDNLKIKIARELGLDLTKGSFSLSRNVSEIFTVVYIHSSEGEWPFKLL